MIPRRYTPSRFRCECAAGGGAFRRRARENARHIRALLGGTGAEAHAAAVAVNAGALLMLAGLADRLADGYALARWFMASGGALDRLERFAELSRSEP